MYEKIFTNKQKQQKKSKKKSKPKRKIEIFFRLKGEKKFVRVAGGLCPPRQVTVQYLLGSLPGPRKFLGEAAHPEAVARVVSIRGIQVAAVEIQVEAVRGTVRTTYPKVPVATNVVRRACGVVAVARRRQEKR